MMITLSNIYKRFTKLEMKYSYNKDNKYMADYYP